MKNFHLIFIIILYSLFTLYGCGTYKRYTVKPTSILQAQKEIPEEQLLDVGITVFKSKELTEEEAKEEGTHPAIRKAEGHYIPYHLKKTLQQSSQWGSIWVIPSDTGENDVVVKGEVVESHGERLVVKVEVSDVSGRTWFRKKYKAKAQEGFYSGNVPGQTEAFQDLYNTIANDMTHYRDEELTAEDIKTIRQISQLKFAENFAPLVFDKYLTEDEDGNRKINRLPADDDPILKRLLRIRERDYMFLDALNAYYEKFYLEMWPEYENWRQTNLVEQEALRKIKRDALIRKLGGILLIASAIALEIGDVDNTSIIKGGLILIGGQVVINGFNVSKQAEIHTAAIEELADTFGTQMQPVVMDFEGKKIELTGSAEKQYAQWRELLRKIYQAETGFSLDVPDEVLEDTGFKDNIEKKPPVNEETDLQEQPPAQPPPFSQKEFLIEEQPSVDAPSLQEELPSLPVEKNQDQNTP
jgi:hypothetical protein